MLHIIIIIRCQIWNRHWRPCLSKHLCHQTTSKNLNPYFVHLLPSYKDYQEMLFVVCPYRVCLLLYQLKMLLSEFKVFGFVMVFLGWYNSGFPLPTVGLCTVYSASLCQTNDCPQGSGLDCS